MFTIVAHKMMCRVTVPNTVPTKVRVFGDGWLLSPSCLARGSVLADRRVRRRIRPGSTGYFLVRLSSCGFSFWPTIDGAPAILSGIGKLSVSGWLVP